MVWTYKGRKFVSVLFFIEKHFILCLKLVTSMKLLSVEGRNIFLIYDTQLMASYAPHEMFAWSELIVSDTFIYFYIDIVTS